MTCRQLRIVYENYADRADSVVALSPPPAGMGYDRLKTEKKGEFLRLTTSSPTLDLYWNTPVPVDCVAIPACNLSPEAQIRVRVFDALGTSVLWSSDWVWACPGPVLDHWNFHQPLNANGFAYGATVVAVWVPNIMAGRVEIQIVDPQRQFIDISRLVIGPAYKPYIGASYGSATGMVDMTKTSRTAGGDLKINQGPKRRTVNLNLATVAPEDRHLFSRIIQQGLGRRWFISGLSGDSDVTLEQDYMLYGTLTSLNGLDFASYGAHQTQYQIEEW